MDITKKIIFVFIYYSLFTNVLLASGTEEMEDSLIEARLYANVGDSIAQKTLAYYYEIGYLVKKDLKTAIYWYKKSAVQGNLFSQYNLAEILFKLKEYREAFFWRKKVADASDEEFLSQLAQYELSEMYENEQGGNYNLDKRNFYLYKSANNGFIPAQIKVGLYAEKYLNDYETAFKYFVMAVDHSASDLESYNGLVEYHLGRCFFYGIGTTKDLKKARIWISKSDKKGYGKSKELLSEILKEIENLKSDTLNLRKEVKLSFKKRSLALSKMREGRALMSAKSTSNNLNSSQYGSLSASTDNSKANARGAQLIKEGEDILNEIKEQKRLLDNKVYNSIRLLKNVTLRSKKDNKNIKCIVLKYVNGNLIMINIKTQKIVEFDAKKYLASESIMLLENGNF